MKADGSEVYDERNLVILSRFDISAHHQYKNDFAFAPLYRKVTEEPREDKAKEVAWERPILYAKVSLAGSNVLHVVNVHLKSRIPTNIDGQKVGSYAWKTASGWTEGYFLSSMKRVGQALETRMLIDSLFDENEDAHIAVCGDFNADLEDVPVAAIRGNVEDTGNVNLVKRIMVPCEQTIPEPSRFSLYHHGKGCMLDHLLVSRSLLAFYRGSEIHNEVLHDESVSYATDKKYPESDHAPVVADFELPDL
jgi:predicted extracellular nuclease